jgi:hypothetical protein
MVVSNVKIVSRKIKGFTANSEQGQDSINISGTYIIEIQNNGIVPTASLSFRLSKFTYGSGNDIITGKNKNLGRIQPAAKKKVEFEISEEITDTPENIGTVQRSCNNNLIASVSEEKVTGVLFQKSFSRSGGIPVSSTSCSVAQLQEGNNQNGGETDDDPPANRGGLPSEPENGEILVSLPEMPEDRDNPRMGIEAFTTITESGQEVSQQIVVENTGTQRVAPRFAQVILDGNEVVDTCGEGIYEIGAGEVGTITLSGTVDVEPGDYGIGITVNGDIELRESETDPANGNNNEDDSPQNGGGGGGGQESNIEGPNVLGVGQEGVYRWDDFPPETVLFRYQLLSEGGGEDAPEDATSLELADGSGRNLVLNLTSDIEGDFLLRVIASAGGERLAQDSKVISVVESGAAAQ